MSLVAGIAEPADNLAEGIVVPEYLRPYRR
jgi:hypothetical protein